MDDISEKKHELDGLMKTLARTEENTDMWRRLLEDYKKKQEQEIERLRHD